jgi:CheY-like chemotaxis protein
MTSPRQLRRVLVVDDNRDAADSLALILALKGFDVRAAYDGMEALEVCQLFKPDVAVLDLNMPRLNGFETASAMAMRRPTPILVALTSDGSDVARARAKNAGFKIHLVKPADLMTVLEALQSGSGTSSGTQS